MVNINKKISIQFDQQFDSKLSIQSINLIDSRTYLRILSCLTDQLNDQLNDQLHQQVYRQCSIQLKNLLRNG